MQISLIVSFMLILVSPVGQVLAGPDIPTSSSRVTQKKPAQGNGVDKSRKGHDKAGGDGVVSGLEVGGSAKSASSISVSPGVGLSSDGRPVLRDRRRLPDPRSER